MEYLKKWIRNNGATAILVVLFIVLLINTDARAWLMRQIASTGILNSSISEPKEKEGGPSSARYADLIVRNEEGAVLSTSALKGKVVFINFWASWCPPCRAEFPSIQEFYNRYSNHPQMVFLTVNLDENPVLGKNYIKEKGFTIPFLTSAGNIPREYFNGSLPTTVVLDKKGEIRLHHSGLADYSKDSFYFQIDALLKQKP
ncbi:MAG: TlpA family protein disulfide reductase [Chryseobacterium sp.]|uniref:TlpA family protein disulfide reductase n=1 Tax=Chryseobacterium sp. TaxID=1871047 RepID=UPI0025C2DF7A|nr:TlpA disulfide reductase family protein [Chryseobacterium sp.]MCJ7935652.1 TlpA family protein disulfide reductase [Chryseobacterium sp.]